MRTPFVAACLCLLPACATTTAAPADPAAGLLSAVAWTQTAAEHDLVCERVFADATNWVQTQMMAQRLYDPPAAVIVDVDETMLDNSSFQARLVLDHMAFGAERWNAWCEEAKATAIPGALAFARACHDAKVTVFYVTNRDQSLEAATRRNLQALGFPLDDRPGVDVVLCKGEVDGKSSKEGRRATVRSASRVLALVGDDLGDFVEPAATVAARRAQVDADPTFVMACFVLPNPMYGSWERAAGDLRQALDPRR